MNFISRYIVQKKQRKKVPAHSEIIYLGWIMAGGIKGYKDMVKKYNVRAVCAVGMSRTGTQTEEVRAKNSIPKNHSTVIITGKL